MALGEKCGRRNRRGYGSEAVGGFHSEGAFFHYSVIIIQNVLAMYIKDIRHNSLQGEGSYTHQHTLASDFELFRRGGKQYVPVFLYLCVEFFLPPRE